MFLFSSSALFLAVVALEGSSGDLSRSIDRRLPHLESFLRKKGISSYSFVRFHPSVPIMVRHFFPAKLE